jgi:hypothetical protein
MTTFQPANSNAVFLPTTIQYPKDQNELLNRLNKAYEDTASRLNAKQIGIFDLVEFLTGEQWPVVGDPQKKRQTFRKIFFFSDASLTFAHGITGITLCTHIYGAFTDGTNFYPLPFVSSVAIANQIQIVVTPVNVVVTKGGGAPAITNGVIVLEYLLN